MKKGTILSGMRPTGRLHLGHLLGAIENWRSLQDEYHCFYMIADWHALMSEYHSPAAIRQNIIDCLVDWISFGIDPEKSVIFIQSQVPEHTELHMIFSMFTPLPWLQRCPTYKEQLRELKEKDIFTYAFLGYPVLQAADILLYKATAVPVGKDQLPHLELTREISRRFNSLYVETFPEPDALLTKVPKLLGLDGRKMSKSYNNYIALSDPPDEVMKKTKQMFTDPQRIRLSDPGHPDKCNVYSYWKTFADDHSPAVAAWCKNATKGCTECKKLLGESLVETLREPQEKRKELLEDTKKISQILEDGATRARQVAGKTLSEVKRIVGI